MLTVVRGLAKSPILECLVEAEERAGHVRWLRPDYQRPRFGGGAPEATLGLPEAPLQEAAPDGARPEWPSTVVEQIGALQALLSAGAVTVESAMAHFEGARREHVARHLETLALMGEVQRDEDGGYSLLREGV